MERPDDDPRGEEEEPEIESRFPTLGPMPDVPDAPRLSPELPRHPSLPRPGAPEPGSAGKSAIAATAASSFVMPVIVLSVGGYLLDKALHHQTYWLAFVGVLLGFVAGIAALLNVIRKLSE